MISIQSIRPLAAFRPITALVSTALTLAACAMPQSQFPVNEQGYIKEVPASIASLTAPEQDLTRVQLRPEDRCFWYMHAGPVEDTMIPLRATGGNPICIP